MSQIGSDKNKNTFKNSQSNNSAPNNSTNNSNSSNDVARSGVTNGSYGVYTQPSSNSYNATSYVNQNLEDAEREYQEQMHSYSSNRGANTQSNGRPLYETNASSYSTQRNFSFADSNVGRTMPKGTQFKLENFAKSTVSGTTSMVYGMSQIGQTEAGRGLSIAKNTIVIGGSLAVATTVAIPKQLCKAAMKSSARQEFGSIKEMKEALKEINKTMKKHGLPPLRGSGNNLWIESRKALRRLRRSNAPQELIEAAEKGMRIGKYTAFNKKGASRGFKRSVRFVANEFTKYLNQNDAGRGLSYTSSILTRSISALKSTVRFVHQSNKIIAFVGKKAMVAAAKGAVKRAAKLQNMASSITVANGSYGELANQLTKKAEKLTKKSERINKKLSKDKLSTRIKNKIGEWTKPFRTKVKTMFKNGVKAIHNFMYKNIGVYRWTTNGVKFVGKGVKKVGTKLSNSIFGKIGRGIANIVAHIMNAIRSAISVIWAICGGLLVVSIVAIIVILIILLIRSLFDFGRASNKEIAIATLEDCFVKDIEFICNNYGGYTLTFDNSKMNISVYEDLQKNRSEEVYWTQTSNCAEILSMVYVQYGMDFNGDDDKLKEIEDTIRYTYYGSHTIHIYSNSKKIVYETVYFDSLFECGMDPGESGHSPTQLYNVNISADGYQEAYIVYKYLCENGFSHESACAVAANLEHESQGWDTDIISNDGSASYGLAQWTDTRKTNLFKYAEDKGKSYDDFNLQIDFMLNGPGEGDSQFSPYTGITAKWSHGRIDSPADVIYKGELGYENATGADVFWPTRMTLEEFKTITDVNLATEIWSRVYHRPNAVSVLDRQEQARIYDEWFSNNFDVNLVDSFPYSQSDAQWGLPSGCCGICAYANAFASFGVTNQKGDIITPKDVFIGSNESNMTYHSDIVTYTNKINTTNFDICVTRYVSSNVETIINYLNNGSLVMVYMEDWATWSDGETPIAQSQHWIILTSYNEDTQLFKAMDSWQNANRPAYNFVSKATISDKSNYYQGNLTIRVITKTSKGNGKYYQ